MPETSQKSFPKLQTKCSGSGVGGGGAVVPNPYMEHRCATTFLPSGRLEVSKSAAKADSDAKFGNGDTPVHSAPDVIYDIIILQVAGVCVRAVVFLCILEDI